MEQGKRSAEEGVAGGSEAICAFLRGIFPAKCHHLIWLAGGTVRDALLRRQIKDIDLVAALSAPALQQLGFHPVVGKTAGSIWFRKFAAVGNVEITRIAEADALGEDLRRRDFTVNAMLMTLAGEPVDPLGGGSDLQKKTLRACCCKTFSDDPLRIFRAFRFAAEGFSLAEETAALIRCRGWEDELQKIPVERFSREMLKAFSAKEPQKFFLAMLEFSVGRHWLPELFRMPLIPAGPLHHHPEGDLFTHSVEVLARVSLQTDANLARFCAFFHDIGKLSTDEAFYPHHHGHEDSGFAMAIELCRRLALPRKYGKALAWISRLHGKANRFAELRPATRIRMAEMAVKGEIARVLPLIAAADKAGNKFDAEWQLAVAVVGMNAMMLGIEAEKLTSMDVSKRADLILQRRVELLNDLQHGSG